MTKLRDFIMEYIDRPFVWGADDCSLFVADWWFNRHGIDPAAHLRGTYSDQSGKVALVTAAGGLVRLVDDCARRVGSPRTRHPVEGDIAVVLIDGVYFSAICAGDMWAIRSESGVIFTADAKVVRAWAV